MSWVKRNLYFLIGSLISLALLGAAGFYFYSKWSLNNKVLEDLTQKHEDLKKLNSEPILPGPKNENTEKARDEIKEIKAALDKTRAGFQKIARIPDLPKLTDFEFSTALARTIAELAKDATNNGVSLPATNYSFSFQKQRNQMNFLPASLVPLSVQLGEVKAICDNLFSSKINSLEALRRERASADDLSGSQADYLNERSVTNALAVLTPYEIVFHCFSPELANVLSGFANSRNGFIVQFINVEPAPVVAVEPTPMAPVAPIYVAPPPQQNFQNEENRFRSRYGLGGPGGAGGVDDAAFRARYGLGPGGASKMAPQPQPYQPVAVAPGAGQPKPLQTVIDERQLRVTMLIDIVKLASGPANPGK
jgi:hypothetical protein